MSWFNKRKVTIDMKKECDNKHTWTLIDNEFCQVKSFCGSDDLVKYLYESGYSAKDWIDEKIEEKKANRHFTFYINKDVAPLIINKMDAMECVDHWSIDKTELFNDMLVVKYDASKQVLFQTSNGVVVKEY